MNSSGRGISPRPLAVENSPGGNPAADSAKRPLCQNAGPHAQLDLHQRRLLAAAQERLAQALFDETTPATDIVTLLEEEALRVQAALRHTTAGRLQWASALLPQVLADADARRLQREATGSAVLGVPTGVAQLDNMLGGLNPTATLV